MQGCGFRLGSLGSWGRVVGLGFKGLEGREWVCGVVACSWGYRDRV